MEKELGINQDGFAHWQKELEFSSLLVEKKQSTMGKHNVRKIDQLKCKRNQQGCVHSQLIYQLSSD